MLGLPGEKAFFEKVIKSTFTIDPDSLTLNPQPLHIDRHFCEQETEWGQPLMNSLFTLGLMIGIQVSDMTVGTTIANLGMTEVKFPHPLFEGDTVHVTTEVLGKRESKSRPGAGIVEFHHRTYNQANKLGVDLSYCSNFLKCQDRGDNHRDHACGLVPVVGNGRLGRVLVAVNDDRHYVFGADLSVSPMR